MFNTTDILTEDHSAEEGFLIEAHKRQSNATNTIYSFQKNSMQSTFMIAVETGESSETSYMTLYEIITPQKASNDFFSNLRFPVILLSIVFVIGYQIWSKKGGKLEGI